MGSEVAESPVDNSWFSNWVKWCPTSEELLETAESKILASLDITYKGQYIRISDDQQIWSVVFNPEGTKTPLLMVHGLGTGLAMWAMNFKELSQDRPVYTFDLLGFGRSTRPSFDEDSSLIEDIFVNSIEKTREKLGLDSFILIGHSFGGYLSYSYTLKHPDKVKSLILVDPWGFTEKSQDWEKNVAIPSWIKVMAAIMSPFNPYAMLRFVGPLGPSMLSYTRPDLKRKFSSMFTDDTILNYIYHCNAQTPSGETAFKKLTIPYLWPKYPMKHRMDEISSQVKVFMLFGSRTWIDEVFVEIKQKRKDQFHILTIKNAGHHVFADRPDAFNKVVKSIVEDFDHLSN